MDSKFWSQVNFNEVPLLEEIYAKFLRNEKIDLSWKHFFEGYHLGFSESKIDKENEENSSLIRLSFIKNIYRLYGYLEGTFSPLMNSISNKSFEKKYESFVFSDDEEVPSLGLSKNSMIKFSQFIKRLKELYCGNLCIEVLNCSNEIQEDTWNFIENLNDIFFTVEDQCKIFEDVVKATLFEEFLHVKFTGKKRFSLEGAESLIPMLRFLIEEGSTENIDNFFIGISHRGRLNVLVNILNKPFYEVFMEFEDNISFWDLDTIGDVKYHLGYTNKIKTQEDKEVLVSMLPNSSHLESIDPILSGVVKSKQILENKDSSTLAICIHGEAALSGQGVVYETMQLHGLDGFNIQGTIHIIVNNYVGFTTNPKQYRSTSFSSDIGKMFNFPIIHVNQEDVEACCKAVRLALLLRKKHHCDVIIELCSYRKYGHNETDEPLFTQPLEYQIIKRKSSLMSLYRSYLTSLDQNFIRKLQSIENSINNRLKDDFQKVLNKENYKDKKLCKSCEFLKSGGLFTKINTTLSLDFLSRLGEKLCFVPECFNLHRTLRNILDKRLKMTRGEINCDWSTAEQLAIASLLVEGTHVRISGEDVIRGTFSQRHLVWYDQEIGDSYSPFYYLSENQGKAMFYNSPISEYGVLGFEFGYSLENPTALVIWEAQFGDFANGGQIIFDQYISSAIQKWDIHSNLVVLLPHGMEGQGPEHSSARIERFLQNASGINSYIISPSTPSQYFHVLRRHMKKEAALPLIIFSHKGLLRKSACSSKLTDFSLNVFEEFLEDEKKNYEAKILILCHGRIYYDFLEYKDLFKKELSFSCIRIEQLFPFNYEKFLLLLKRYKKMEKIVWLQEEPSNMGAYEYMFMVLKDLLGDMPLHYVGRARSASPATGSYNLYKKELDELMNNLFSLNEEF